MPRDKSLLDCKAAQGTTIPKVPLNASGRGIDGSEFEFVFPPPPPRTPPLPLSPPRPRHAHTCTDTHRQRSKLTYLACSWCGGRGRRRATGGKEVGASGADTAAAAWSQSPCSGQVSFTRYPLKLHFLRFPSSRSTPQSDQLPASASGRAPCPILQDCHLLACAFTPLPYFSVPARRPASQPSSFFLPSPSDLIPITSRVFKPRGLSLSAPRLSAAVL